MNIIYYATKYFGTHALSNLFDLKSKSFFYYSIFIFIYFFPSHLFIPLLIKDWVILYQILLIWRAIASFINSFLFFTFFSISFYSFIPLLINDCVIPNARVIDLRSNCFLLLIHIYFYFILFIPFLLIYAEHKSFWFKEQLLPSHSIHSFINNKWLRYADALSNLLIRIYF